MIKKIIHTLYSRGLTIIAGFALVFITARFLGAEIRGMISLFIFALAIITTAGNIIGGPVLVYRASRHSLKFLVKYAISWSIITGVSVPFILMLTGLTDLSMALQLLIPGILLSLITSGTGLMLGSGKLFRSNNISMLQAVLLPGILTIFIILNTDPGFRHFLWAAYLTYIITFLPVFWSFRKIAENTTDNNESIKEIKPVFFQGSIIQGATLFQLFSYRAAFWFLSYREIGIFSIAIALGEAAWIITKSLSVYQYGEISMSRDENYNRNLTKLLLWITLSATALILIGILLIPESLIGEIFGNEFRFAASVIPFLTPGILFLAASNILTHYFSGTGKNNINLTGSFAGAVTSILLCALLIPRTGMFGAAAATSTGYLVSLVYLSWCYYRSGKNHSGGINPEYG